MYVYVHMHVHIYDRRILEEANLKESIAIRFRAMNTKHCNLGC